MNPKRRTGPKTCTALLLLPTLTLAAPAQKPTPAAPLKDQVKQYVSAHQQPLVQESSPS